ncbi:leucine-rich repeat domain-containing protein [Methanobrevibacter sp.]|uniref:leucine-rich repeat domain-containing protein n=1 Tax=Methanobrevibacter sp. TaxID=66852 RepID=UPI00388E87C1
MSMGLKKTLAIILSVIVVIGISVGTVVIMNKQAEPASTTIENGLSAYELAVQYGYGGTVQEWLDSLNGKSSYEIAKENGYTGTETEWTASLKAAAGKDGVNGIDGIGISSSVINNDGELVVTYTNGQTANLGVVIGDKGEKGDKGDQGVQGVQGIQGETGAAGRGIVKTEISDNNLIIYYTDNTTEIHDLSGILQEEITNQISYLTYTELTDGTYSVSLNTTFKNSIISINIPDSYNGKPVTTIAENAFNNASQLEFVKIPETVTSIEKNAFSSCKALKNIQLPSGLNNIGTYAFTNCQSLEKIVIPNNVTNIGTYAFNNCDNLTEVVLPSNMEEIPAYLFYSCEKLTNITIPTTVTTIGNGAFKYCDALSYIEFPENLVSIGDQAFYRTSLSDIVIPSKVTNIGERCFYDAKLTSVVFLDTNNWNYHIKNTHYNEYNGSSLTYTDNFTLTATEVSDSKAMAAMMIKDYSGYIYGTYYYSYIYFTKN